MPSMKPVMSAPSYKPQPVIKTSTSQPQTKKQSKHKSRQFDDDDSDEDYPSMGSATNLSLNNFSMKTVKNSGQDLSYSAAQVTSNIRTVSKSVLDQAQQNSSSSSSGKVSVNSTAEFPGLGRPQQTLDLSLAKNKKSKNKNKKNNNDSSYASMSRDNKNDKSSLNSICDFLGGGAAVKVTEKKVKQEEAVVKPIVSKSAEETIVRPSKTKSSNINNNIENKPVKKNEETGEDFPSLGKSSKKLSRNFVSADEKLVQQKSVFNQWSKNMNQVENNLHNTHISKSGARRPALGFDKKVTDNFKYSAPSDFQQRNVGLIRTISDLIGGKSLEFKTFKDISGKFRTGQMECDVYYVECKQLMNENQFNKVFPELLALLPDIMKQQQLYELYTQDSWFNDSLLRVCDTCLQVNKQKDHPDHSSHHSFPSL